MAEARDCYAIRFPGMPGYGAVSVIGNDRDTAQFVARAVKDGGVIETVTRSEAVAGLHLYSDEKKRRRIDGATRDDLPLLAATSEAAPEARQ